MSESHATFHVGLTPERIVDVALELTRDTHLFGWSLRALAGRLDVVPSVIYHHVGGKDLLARHVVERVVAQIVPPSPASEWQAWFEELLGASYPIVAAYPGVAKWLLMHGPTFPAVLPIIEAGIAALRRGGFGHRAGIAYATLLNNAMLTISMGDERLLHEEDGPRDHATMMAEFRAAAASLNSPELTLLGEAFMRPFADGGQAAAAQRRRYYDFVVTTTIAGLASLPGTAAEE